MKLTIILPCYNVATLVKRCLNSIYTQNVSYDFEVIAVNDASTDNTLETLHACSLVYHNLKIIDKSYNEKLSAARSTGMQTARGDYILHLDPDDYLLPDTLNSVFVDRGCDWDILFYNIIIVSKVGQKKEMYPKDLQPVFNLKKKKDEIKLAKVIKGSCFGKIIKRNLLLNLFYYNFKYNVGEDIAFNFEVFNKCKVVAYDSTPFYHYTYNTNSLIRGKFNIDRLNYYNSWIHNVNLVKDNNVIFPYFMRSIKALQDRYIIGLLLLIRKDDDNNQIVLYDMWKQFINHQLPYFNPTKQLIYRTILKIDDPKKAIPLFLISLGQIAPYKERILRKIKK